MKKQLIMSKLMKNSFPALPVEAWETLSLKTLNKETLEDLQTKTYENMILSPLYTSNDKGMEGAQIPPGLAPFIRGVRDASVLNRPWKIAQWVTSLPAGLDDIKTLEQKGQDVISFQTSLFSESELEYWKEILAQLPLKEVFIELDEEEHDWLTNYDFLHSTKGFIGFDPIKYMIESESSQDNLKQYYAVLSNGIKLSSADQKNILIDNTIFHNSGADIITELASVLAVAAEHIDRLEGAEATADSILSKMIVRIGVGGSFFLELAKIRALRYLWYKFTSAYELKNETCKKITIAAETSLVTKTIYDQYVNVLRSGNEAFAAVTAGVDYLTITPFDVCLQEKTELAVRIARNTHHLLAEESHINRVLDPAGGSWYVESLTKEIIEKAWELFIEIEERGGILACIETGWMQHLIKNTREAKIQAVKERRMEIIGTNMYVDVNDRKPDEKLPSSGTRLGFPSFRLSEAFERWRLYFDRHPVKVAIIGLGNIKDYKVRRDMARNWFASVGIRTDFFAGVDSFSKTIEKYKAVCICGTDESYETWDIEYGDIAKKFPVFAAGRPRKTDSMIAWIYPELEADHIVSGFAAEGEVL
ncbi:methylmalonyl-CoA mutase family protein [Bacillus litorisediminis]|uniref:methylmalonyl-CoA mutase family protein n=1 Tax=Bacillus litorisediminis TaxID=2922713 RepID=UPI001FAE6754|nr:methylmalonyl-CoA mutase family protein [Bacillus litorisediminis]